MEGDRRERERERHQAERERDTGQTPVNLAVLAWESAMSGKKSS